MARKLIKEEIRIISFDYDLHEGNGLTEEGLDVLRKEFPHLDLSEWLCPTDVFQ
jgi:hypothetical protein